MIEFSKKVVIAMVILWFIVAIFAMCIVYSEKALLESLLSFVGALVTGSIVLYMAKSAFENREKIKQDYISDDEDDYSPPSPPIV